MSTRKKKRRSDNTQPGERVQQEREFPFQSFSTEIRPVFEAPFHDQQLSSGLVALHTQLIQPALKAPAHAQLPTLKLITPTAQCV